LTTPAGSFPRAAISDGEQRKKGPVRTLTEPGLCRFSQPYHINSGAIAVFTAMCMCWSGYLSTHVSMMDVLDCNKMTGKAIVFHTVGGLCTGIFAHWLFMAAQLL